MHPKIQPLIEESERIHARQMEISAALRATPWEDAAAIRPLIVELDATIVRVAELVIAEIELSAELGLEIDPERREAGRIVLESSEVLHDMHAGMLAAIDGGWWPNQNPPDAQAAG